MNTLYKKNELTFSLLWIGIYVVVFSIADSISEGMGVIKIITAPICVIGVVILIGWLKKHDLLNKYGLCKTNGILKKPLYYIPLILIVSVNLWNGVELNYTVIESVLYVVSMLCVGFLEEVIFRGFLFKALCTESEKQAIVISSVTFGIGHIVNLLNGAEFLSTFLQICYAVAIGFLFTVIFYRTGSLLPCIIAHGLTNSLSTFAVSGSIAFGIVVSIFLIVVSVSFGIIIYRKENRRF